MRKIIQLVVVSAALCTCSCVLHGQAAPARQKLALPSPEALVIDKSMPANGTLVMEVNVGGVKIVRSEQEKTIRLEIDPHAFYDDSAVKSWVRRFEVAGDRASIELKLPKHNESHTSPEVIVYLPAHTDLKMELGVGDLDVNGIEGNKDLHVGIGDLNVGIADGAQYNSIQTGTKIGDANDNVFRQHSSGFFPKTSHASTQGRFKLTATVGIGDVNVVQD